jgi:DNA replication protein DnaC
VVGIALKTGKEANLLVLDIDDLEKFKQFYNLSKEETGYIIRSKTPGHYHVGFLYDPDFVSNKDFRREAGFELKVNSLINFYSIDPDAQYKPIKLEALTPITRELKEKILALIRRQKETPESPEKPKPEGLAPSQVIELVSEVYLKGQRQYWTIYTAGYLRKLGVPFEEAKEALEEFLRSQGDEELEMRLAGIEHTYKEDWDNVKGLAGLLELGLSKETYLKLQSLRTQKTKEIKTKTNEKEGEEEERKIKYSIYELLKATFKPPQWIIPGILPEGFTFLGGRPKQGKSFLALQIALTAVQLGKKVVYFALEDGPGRIQARLQSLGLPDLEALKNIPLTFIFELPKIQSPAPEDYAIHKINEHAKEADLIIVDPWLALKPDSDKKKDIVQEEYLALQTIRKLLKNKSVLIVHHTRKAGGEDLTSALLGTTGQTAAVDNIMVLQKGKMEKKAILSFMLRDFEAKDLGLMRLENGFWQIQGTAEEMMLAEEQSKIVEAIKKLEEMQEKPTIKAIAELVGKKENAVKVALFELVQKGVVHRKERGVYSLLTKEERTNFTNFPNLTNFTNFPNFPSFDPKVSLVSSTDQNELTFLEQNLQGLQEKVSLVSKVSSVSSEVSSNGSTAPEETPEDYILKELDYPCPHCGGKWWKFSKEVYKQGKGAGSCFKCNHISLFMNLHKT